MDKIDTQGMYKVYDRWPQLAQEAYESNLKPVHFDGIDHIVFAGMGGSGTIGDLFKSILSKTNFHVTIVKGYLLPKTVNKNTLIVCSSVSGNTEETISILNSAKKLDCKIIAFSSGGTVELFCNENNIEYRKIRMIHSPRTSFVIYVYSLLNILATILPIQNTDVLESIIELEELSKIISYHNLNENNPALKLARFIDGIPCIYYPYGLLASAIRFKNSIQENAKKHAFVEDVIEACHNGIVSWEQPSQTNPILIRGTDDFIKTKERWNILKQYFNENKINFLEIVSPKGNILTKIIGLIYELDYASIYLSVLHKIDPSPTMSIDYIKKNMI